MMIDLSDRTAPHMPRISRAACALLAGTLATVALLPSAHAGSEDAETNAAIERGRQIVERDCSECHAVGRTGESPLAKALAMREFKKRWPLEYLAESLAEGIVSGHPDMPAYSYPPTEIGDILAYLDMIGSTGDADGSGEGE